MPDRLELPWIDALAGRTGAADAARVAESLAHDPAAAEAFEGWRRLASAVRDDAAARAGGLPPLDGVLAAIRTPAAHGDGPTPLDRIGRATLRRLAAEPIDVAGAPSPVPAWVIGAAAVAAMVVFALWPTPHGPLGGVFFAALRQQNAQPPIAAAIGPTPVARLRDAAADLRRDRQGVDTGALRANAGDRPGALAALELDGADYDVPLDAVLRWPDGVRGGPGGAAGAAAARTAPRGRARPAPPARSPARDRSRRRAGIRTVTLPSNRRRSPIRRPPRGALPRPAERAGSRRSRRPSHRPPSRPSRRSRRPRPHPRRHPRPAPSSATSSATTAAAAPKCALQRIAATTGRSAGAGSRRSRPMPAGATR